MARSAAYLRGLRKKYGLGEFRRKKKGKTRRVQPTARRRRRTPAKRKLSAFTL